MPTWASVAKGNGLLTKHDSSEFGFFVFAGEVIHQYLSETALAGLARWEKGESITPALADEIANGMRQWAEDRGATHYAHWFQPLTGLTAEKHENFYEVVGGRPLSAFNGEELMQQEPDASSFPSGGLRSTFEARGYTAWDPTSPPFIYGRTLCIPSVYISYQGEALDYKVPLLRSIEALNQAALRVLRHLMPEVRRVTPTLGVEQEFFLIERALFWKRLDLVLTGRTLVGAPSPRGQQLEDHYFGSIPPRVLAFFERLEKEAWGLGIPLKTRHNEVAPSQYECAPTFEELNVAIDHNQLLMDLIQRVAAEFDLAVLFHEKPFAGINGSGKHNNWSLQTDTGVNLLSPGNTPKAQLRFFVVLSVVLRGIYRHAGLLRATIATPGNEHRLGGNEAPPSIISVFLGQALSQAIDQILSGNGQPALKTKEPLGIQIPRIPTVFRDNTDRNRTSPFAFTGNKFELRAVGASAHCAPAMIVLNAAVAEAFQAFADQFEAHLKKGLSRQAALFETMRAFLAESRPIHFDGNNYEKAWVEEAQRRGLPVIYSTPKALEAYLAPTTVTLFEKLGILSKAELEARYEIRLERYVKAVLIELHTLLRLVRTQLLPAAFRYEKQLLDLEWQSHEMGYKVPSRQALIETFQTHVEALLKGVEAAQELDHKLQGLLDLVQKAHCCYDEVRPLMLEIRTHADALEEFLPAEIYPLPRYTELLFYLEGESAKP